MFWRMDPACSRGGLGACLIRLSCAIAPGFSRRGAVLSAASCVVELGGPPEPRAPTVRPVELGPGGLRASCEDWMEVAVGPSRGRCLLIGRWGVALVFLPLCVDCDRCGGATPAAPLACSGAPVALLVASNAGALPGSQWFWSWAARLVLGRANEVRDDLGRERALDRAIAEALPSDVFWLVCRPQPDDDKTATSSCCGGSRCGRPFAWHGPRLFNTPTSIRQLGCLEVMSFTQAWTLFREVFRRGAVAFLRGQGLSQKRWVGT